MHKTILTTALVALGTLLFTTSALGDQTLTRRDYELQRIDLEQDYKARRNANKYAFDEERDALQAARRRANRIDCRDARALRVRAINRDLTALSRDYHANNRAITAWYHNGRDALRTSYEVAQRTARRTVARPVEIVNAGVGYNTGDTVVGRARPVVERAHPVDCSCNVCVPVQVPVQADYGANYGTDYRRGNQDATYRNGREHVPASYRPNPNSNVDWASLIFSLVR